MATIRKRGKRWQVQIRRAGVPNMSRSFLLKADTETWARQKEAEADRGSYTFDVRGLRNITLAEMLREYRDKVVPLKRGAALVETQIINALLSRDVADVSLSDATPNHFSKNRDFRLSCVSPATVVRELGVLQHAFEIARREWGYPISSNPVAQIKKPIVRNRRERRLNAGEYEMLVQSAKKCRNGLMLTMISFALETAMRRGELISVRWEYLDHEKHTLYIPHAKNGHPRTIPLSTRAQQILRNLKTGAIESRVFPISANAVRLAWERIRRRAGLDDLHFHDLRHEAISRLFELGLTVPEVALISGHRDYRQLARYTHLRAEDILKKLR